MRRKVIASDSYRSGLIEIIVTSHSYRSSLIGIAIASYSYYSKVTKSLSLLIIMLHTGFNLITTPGFSPLWPRMLGSVGYERGDRHNESFHFL